MRAGKSYRCPSCGEQSCHPVPCLRCDVLPRDEHGHLPPPLFERRVLFRGLTVTDARSDATGLGDLLVAGASAVRAAARWVAGRRRARRRRRALERTPRSAIADAAGPMIRVAGRAEVLEPADPGHPTTAFLLERKREGGAASSVTIETRVLCSRFLIHDETGSALVDDDYVVVLPRPGASLPLHGDALVRATTGQQVEVCGPAERRMVADLGDLGAPQGYRREPQILCFDGRPESLLLLRPLE